jgi:pimeloyl-ACP methyl ester carboxylesterase
MASQPTITPRSPNEDATSLRDQAFAGIPADERRLELEGVSTAYLEAGSGPPLVLLHGPGANASHFGRVFGDLKATNRLVVPDLPGHGASAIEGELTAQRVIDWLDALIAATCSEPPVLVGNAAGGAVAARFAIERPAGCAALVLVDSLGLRPFQPSPAFGRALNAFVADPNESTYEGLWAHCAHDLPKLRAGMGRAWDAFSAYNLHRAQTPDGQQALGVMMGDFGQKAIPADDLAKIGVPTTLIWGRHDEAIPLGVAEEASARYGWPLYVIEDSADEPPLEQPEAFLRVLRAVLGQEAA